MVPFVNPVGVLLINSTKKSNEVLEPEPEPQDELRKERRTKQHQHQVDNRGADEDQPNIRYKASFVVDFCSFFCDEVVASSDGDAGVQEHALRERKLRR